MISFVSIREDSCRFVFYSIESTKHDGTRQLEKR
jgi:hypothetical protein